jgi:hypothetical protein
MVFTKKNTTIAVLVATVWLWSCNTDLAELNTTPEGVDYFPLMTGHYVSYNVKETNYFLNQPKTEETYQLKEVVAEQLKDLANNNTYRIERYKRLNGRQNWQLLNVWTARIDYRAAVRTEENIPYIKLVFPFERGKKWNGHALNTLEPTNYEMRDLAKPLTLAGKTYTENVTVIQANNPDTLVRKEVKQEIYSKGVGMIYKKSEDLFYCQDRIQGSSCFGKGIIERGNIIEMTIFDVGME